MINTNCYLMASGVEAPYYTDCDLIAPGRSPWTYMQLKHKFAGYIGSREKITMHEHALQMAAGDSDDLKSVLTRIPKDPDQAWEYVYDRLTHAAADLPLQRLLFKGDCIPLFCPADDKTAPVHGLPAYEWKKRGVDLTQCRLSGWYWYPVDKDRSATMAYLHND